MQITKKQFKEILKEAILELVEEGSFTEALKDVITESVLSGQNANVSTIDVLRSSQQVPQYLAENNGTKTVYEQSALSHIPKSVNSNPQLKNLIRATAASQGGENKLMESIFADTALTTFASQREGTNGLVSDEDSPITQQQMMTETKKLESLAPTGDITRWAKVAQMSMQSKKN